MIKLSTIIKDKMGVDKSIAYSSGARVVQAIAGLLTIFFISRYLTGVEQGFYFTFGSIVAIQIFFELGFTSIITQYTAHEFSHLNYSADGLIKDDGKHKSRLTSLMIFCIKWYGIISVALLIVLIVTGGIFFEKYSQGNKDINWEIPWILVSIGTVLKFIESPFHSFLMGIGKVKEMSKITFWQQIIVPLSIWIGLILGANLYVLGISSILNATIRFFFIFKYRYHLIIFDLLRTKVTERISYMREIFPFQWKISLSWISGYFIFQLFNPVLFATEGAVVAGQMGMTLSVLNAIQAFCMSWINTKVPRLSGHIALKEYHKLDALFNKTFKQQMFICFGLLFIMFSGIVFLRFIGFMMSGTLVADRFLPLWPLLAMILATFIQQPINDWATYCRCHKQEPFLLLSVVIGSLCCASTFFLGHLYGLWGIVGGYVTIEMLSFVWSYRIYTKFKRVNHLD